MFKLPICPYCKTVYSYKEVKNNKKEFICYHCKNKIKVKKAKGFFVLFILISILATAVNTLILKIIENITNSFLPLFIASFLCVLIGFLLFPYFTHYIKDKKEKQEKEIPNIKILEENKKIKRSLKNKKRKSKEI